MKRGYTCISCGSKDVETWTEEIEYGSPINRNSTGAVAPKYRTKRVRFISCNYCEDYHYEDI